MVAPEDLADLIADPYRVACPEGHTALTPAETTDSAYCRTCGQSYATRDLLDRRREDPSKRHRGRKG